MQTGEFCYKCGAPLSRDEIGLHKKTINRGDTTYMCEDCICAHFHFTRADADKLIANFRKAGCHYFS